MSFDRSLLSALIGVMNEDRETFVPARLSILSYLYFIQKAKFTDIQKTLNLTSGNLSSHIRKLESLGLVRVSKRFVELKPTTIVVITPEGAERVKAQLRKMRELVVAMMEEDSMTRPLNAKGTAEL